MALAVLTSIVEVGLLAEYCGGVACVVLRWCGGVEWRCQMFCDPTNGERPGTPRQPDTPGNRSPTFAGNPPMELIWTPSGPRLAGMVGCE